MTAANGQMASCSFTVTVTDNEAPAIVCPLNESVDNDLGRCCGDVSHTAPVALTPGSRVDVDSRSGLSGACPSRWA
ncbi:MAG: hypothetical protein IPJ00_14635 [Saprospirales bacterium]|nr:hypothetical protein [Saprospirales bacterium]